MANEPDDKLIGSRIREARKSAGYTQAELGEELSLSQAAINKIENGASSLTLDNLFKLSAVLDHPIIHFLNIGTGALSADEAELLEFYRSIPQKVAKEAIVDMVRSLAQRYKKQS